MSILGTIASAILPKIFDTVDKAVKDKDQAEKLKSDLQLALLDSSDKELENKAKVVIAEARGESVLQRTWRPITMLTFVAILANNFILVPYVAAFGADIPVLEIPPGMYGLLTVGIGGYVGGRTIEKIKGTT